MNQPQRKGQKRSSARWTPIEMVGGWRAGSGRAVGGGQKVSLRNLTQGALGEPPGLGGRNWSWVDPKLEHSGPRNCVEDAASK